MTSAIDRSATTQVPQAVYCGGKQPFASITLANKVATRGNRSGARLSAYKCMACGAFHIGQRGGGKKLQRRAGERMADA